jgi:hypothetical protein
VREVVCRLMTMGIEPIQIMLLISTLYI